MYRCIAIACVALLLVACQTDRVNRDFDAQRDFAAYRTWTWKEPGLQYQPNDPRIKSDLTEQRIRQSVGEQLEQRGLRMTAPGGKADVQVQAWLIVENRQQMVTTNYGGGGYWGNPWGGYWGGPIGTETRSVNYKVSTLQIDMLDGKDGKLVWRGSTEQFATDSSASPAARELALRQTVQKILQQYPPH